MKEYSEIAFNIINNFLKIHKNDIVAISGEIHNNEDSPHPLVEFPLIEELAVAVRKKNAFPKLNIYTQNLKKRFKQEIPEEIFSSSQNHYFNWIDSVDSFIEIGWKRLSEDFESTSENKLRNPGSTESIIFQKIIKQKKKIIFLNFPTYELAEKTDSDFEELNNSYLKAIKCNYNTLKMKAKDFQEDFFSFSNYRISSGIEELDLKLIKNEYQLFMGESLDHQIIVLPAGVIEFPIDKNFLNGTFFAEKIYYKNLIYKNVKINFLDGSVRFVSFEAGEKGNYRLQNAITSSQKESFFSIGFNSEISCYTNFYLYDRCINGNISLKFFDKESYPIVFSSKNAEIKKRK